MGASITAIREALADQIHDGTGREVHAYAYPPGAPGELPCVIIRRAGDGEGVNYHVDMGTQCDINLTLVVVAPVRVAQEDGLRVLDELLSADASLPNSVVDAVESDTTLGGLVDVLLLGSASDEAGFGNVVDGRPEGVMSTIPVAIWTSKS